MRGLGGESLADRATGGERARYRLDRPRIAVVEAAGRVEQGQTRVVLELAPKPQRQLREADLYGPNLRWAIDRAGGERSLKECGQVYTGIFQVPSVAWYLHLHIDDVGIFPYGPGTTLATRYSWLSKDARYPTFAETNKWLLGSSCQGLRPPAL